MAIASDRLVRRVRRDFGAVEAVDYLLADLEGERLQAAIILWAQGDFHRLREAASMAHTDWRDALVRGGLGDDGWQRRLQAELGA